jgi:hypothetical protein
MFLSHKDDAAHSCERHTRRFPSLPPGAASAGVANAALAHLSWWLRRPKVKTEKRKPIEQHRRRLIFSLSTFHFSLFSFLF